MRIYSLAGSTFWCRRLFDSACKKTFSKRKNCQGSTSSVINRADCLCIHRLKLFPRSSSQQNTCVLRHDCKKEWSGIGENVQDALSRNMSVVGRASEASDVYISTPKKCLFVRKLFRKWHGRSPYVFLRLSRTLLEFPRNFWKLTTIRVKSHETRKLP